MFMHVVTKVLMVLDHDKDV